MSSWIKIRSHLANHPKVLRISCALKVHPSRILGCLVYIWSVADMHADGECLPHMTTEVLDQMVDLPGLSDQLIRVDWMRVQDDGLYLPNYQEHNGANAKRRALEAKRKGSVREVSASDADNMRTTCGHDADVRRNECGHDAELDKSKSKSKRKKNTSSSLRSEEVSAVAETAPPPAATEPPLATVATKGKRKEWHLLASHIADWKAAYPGLDIQAEIRKALTWLNANPEKRRTAQGMPRFLVNWFNRCTDRPGIVQAASKPPPPAPRPWSEVFAEQEQAQGRLIDLEVRHG